MTLAYYNENDPGAAAWLRELIKRGLIAPGDVDERSIEDVRPADLLGYRQHHFFAGIGGWSYALRLAGWPDDQPVWTASCPCQPFSASGKGGGFDDERHLWPAFFHLVRQYGPAKIIGEQVAHKRADPWIDLVHADLEAVGYAFGCVPFPSAGIGSPHIRDRNYWVAHADDEGLQGRRISVERAAECLARACGLAGGLADANGGNASAEREQRSGEHGQQPAHGDAVRLADPHGRQCIGLTILRGAERNGQDAGWPKGSGEFESRRQVCEPGPANGFWRDADWIGCTDGKWRPVEPGTFPLAHGIPARMGLLRGYGNAINAEAAAEFIRACAEACRVELRLAA